MQQRHMAADNRQRARTTKQIMIDYFGPSVIDGVGEAPFVAMDGGKFYLNRMQHSELINMMVMLQAGNTRWGTDPIRALALVPVLDDENIFFADIDKVPDNFHLDSFKMSIVKAINAFQNENAIQEKDLYVFKRTNAEKYHIYCSRFSFTKAQRTKLWGVINKAAGFDIIDTSANTIRFEGFLKWNRATSSYERGSAYMPYSHTAGIPWPQLYLRCWLKPRGYVANNQKIKPVLRKPMVLRALEAEGAAGGGGHEQSNDEQPNDEQPNEENDVKLNENDQDDGAGDNNDEEEKLGMESRSGSVEVDINNAISDKLQAEIRRHCPEIAHILWKYPVKSMKKLSGSITFSVAKGHHCPIANRTHKKNNTYLFYSRKAGIVSHRCFDPECSQTNPTGKTIHQQLNERCKDIGTNLPGSSDKLLADYFKLEYPYIVYEPTNGDKEGIWYAYKSDAGYWKQVNSAFITKKLTNEFWRSIQQQYSRAKADHKDDADQILELEAELSKINSKLQNYTGLNGLIKILKHILTPEDPIQWNQNPSYTVFPNGVLQVNRRHPDDPNYYFFGATRAKEYVNNTFCMRYPYVLDPSKPDVMARVKRQAGNLLRNWLMKVMPDEEDLDMLLTFMSLVFTATNYKKMIINAGPSGNNAKSSLFEFLINTLGSYGMIGDKRLILKGPKDRVSKASISCKRFVLFEEPDPGQTMDIETIKDFVGGNEQTTGRMNYSNNNVVHLHAKYAINANVMSSLQLQSAMVSRLLFFLWLAQFTDRDDKVDHENHVYKADPKYKTRAWQERYNDALIYILLEHFKQFQANGNTLKISAKAQQRTVNMLKGSDELIRWFERYYYCLQPVHEQHKHFVTHQDLVREFSKLTATAQRQIIGAASYSVDKFIKDAMVSHHILKRLYKRRYTNYRISAEERARPGAKNKNGEGKQYMLHVLFRVILIEEAESKNLSLETMSFGSLNGADDAGGDAGGDGENKNDEEPSQVDARISGLYRNLRAMSVEESVDALDADVMMQQHAGPNLVAAANDNAAADDDSVIVSVPSSNKRRLVVQPSKKKKFKLTVNNKPKK